MQAKEQVIEVEFSSFGDFVLGGNRTRSHRDALQHHNPRHAAVVPKRSLPVRP